MDDNIDDVIDGVFDEPQSEPDEPQGDEQIGGEPSDNTQDDKPSTTNQDYLTQVLRERAELQRKLEQYEMGGYDDTPIEPDVADFEDWGDYQKAMNRYYVELAKSEIQSQLQQDQSQSKQIEYEAQVATAIDELASQGVNVQDYMAKAEQLPPLPITLDKFGLPAKQTLELAIKLIDNPKTYHELAQLSPYQFALKVGGMLNQQPQKAPPKQSKAPAPIKPVGGNTPANIDTYELSDDDFFKARGIY